MVIRFVKTGHQYALRSYAMKPSEIILYRLFNPKEDIFICKICVAVNKEYRSVGSVPDSTLRYFYELLSHSEKSSKETLPASHSAFFSLALSLQA